MATQLLSYMFQTSTLKRPLRTLNYDDTNCLKSGLSEMSPFISAATPPFLLSPYYSWSPFQIESCVKVNALSWVVYFSKIINELIVASIMGKILTNLIVKHFKQIWASFWNNQRILPSIISFFHISYLMDPVMLLASDTLYLRRLIYAEISNLKCIDRINRGT